MVITDTDCLSCLQKVVKFEVGIVHVVIDRGLPVYLNEVIIWGSVDLVSLTLASMLAAARLAFRLNHFLSLMNFLILIRFAGSTVFHK